MNLKPNVRHTPESHGGADGPSWRAAEIVITLIGIALVGAAIGANQRRLDKHFLPSFFMPRRWYVLIETTVRLACAVVGVSLAVVRRPAARVLTRAPRTMLHATVAAILALTASEAALRWVHLRPTEWLFAEEEPRRQPDARLGWVLVPARTGRAVVSGRRVEYAIDAAGYRVRRLDETVDPVRPTMVFIGESVMFGEGLSWNESIPAQVGAALGVQSANLAVHGYGNDQAYLRLQDALPRFCRPVAVVSLFMTALFGRNLDDDRPHLGPGLVWSPARTSSRLRSLAGLLVPYRTDETVDAGVRTTRDVLDATARLARDHGATPLIVVPQFGPEDRGERELRMRILDGTLPSVLVHLDAQWRLSWDRHPNAHGAFVIARAIAERLQRR